MSGLLQRKIQFHYLVNRCMKLRLRELVVIYLSYSAELFGEQCAYFEQIVYSDLLMIAVFADKRV